MKQYKQQIVLKRVKSNFKFFYIQWYKCIQVQYNLVQNKTSIKRKMKRCNGRKMAYTAYTLNQTKNKEQQ